MNKQRRNMIKGPLSRRHNYLKNLYTQSSNISSPSSPAPSTIGSDIEMDDSLSQFSAIESASDVLLSGSGAQTDVANMNDFFDSRTQSDIQMDSFENESIVSIEDDVKIPFGDDDLKSDKVLLDWNEIYLIIIWYFD